MNERGKMTTSWLGMLPMVLSMIGEKDLIEPMDSADPRKEEVLGVADLECRKLYTLYLRMEEQATRLTVDAQYCHGDEQKREELRMQSIEIGTKSHIIKEILFCLLRDKFKYHKEHTIIGVRNGFEVVVNKSRGGILGPFPFNFGGE